MNCNFHSKKTHSLILQSPFLATVNKILKYDYLFSLKSQKSLLFIFLGV